MKNFIKTKKSLVQALNMQLSASKFVKVRGFINLIPIQKCSIWVLIVMGFSTNFAIAQSTCSSANLVVNGDFEQGNTGFTQNFKYKTTSPINCIVDFWDQGTTSIMNDSTCKLHAAFLYWATAGDHTTAGAGGHYLFVQGGGQTNDLGITVDYTKNTVWKQTVNGLTVGKKYTFSYWTADAVMNWDLANNLGDVVIPNHIGSRPGSVGYVDGVPAITINPYPYLTEASQNNWKKYSYSFTATSTSADLEIKNLNPYMAHANDWVLDDIRLECLCDYDNDGIADADDLDDDNDGIPDTVEGCSPSLILNENFGTFGTQTANTRRNLETSPAGYTYVADPSNLAVGNYAVVAQNGAANLSIFNFFEQVLGHTSNTANDAYLAINQAATASTFYSKPFTITQAGNYDFGAFAANAYTFAGYPFEVGIRIKNSSNAVIATTTTGQVATPVGSPATYLNWVKASKVINLANGNYTLEVYNIVTNSLAYGTTACFAIDDIYLKPANKDLACIIDTDNDGIPNSCDLDSDGDGCSDAFEAGATTDQTPNFAFAGNVGTNGLPNAVETSPDNGILNYTSTYTNAVNNSINLCTPPENPKISIVKGSSLNLGADNLATVGDIITYSYEVSNLGNVILSNVTVSEQAALFTGTGILPNPVFVSATLGSAAGTLKVGEKATYSATYALTQADINAGKIDNQAITNGKSPKNVAVSDLSDSKNPADYNETGTPSDPNGNDKTGTPIAENPKISIVKGSSLNLGADNLASIGDIITYSYEVSNLGNVILSNVTVAEQAALFTGTGILPSPVFVSATLGSAAGTLKVGEKATYSATYALTQADINAGKVDNQAITNGKSPKNVAVSDLSDSKNPADYNETGVPSDPNGNDKTGTPIAKQPVCLKTCVPIQVRKLIN